MTIYNIVDLFTDDVLHIASGPVPSQGDAVVFDDTQGPWNVVRVVHQILPRTIRDQIVRDVTVEVYVTPTTQDDINRDILPW